MVEVGGLFLSWRRPSAEQQKACVATSGSFNYDPAFRGRSRDRAASDDLSGNGFFVNRSRVLLGTGPRTFQLAKSALLSWRHFGLDWAFVDPSTPVEEGVRFCACVKELIPWVMMPLQVAYVVTDDAPTIPKSRSNAVVASAPRPRGKASFGFASGTLQGHLLAGEELFSIEWDDNDQIWYEIFSFSKPAHFLSAIGYPYVQLRQKYFAQQSTNVLLNHVAKQQQCSD